MFEKLPSGYRLTAAGEEVLEFADQMEASSHLLETRVFGRDQSVRGLLRVTLPPTLATHLLMPDFAEFARLHSEIEMEITPSGELVNLTNREADVAIRVVYDRKTLPLNLHGLRGPELFGGVYMSRDLLATWRAGAPRSRPVDRREPEWCLRLGARGRGPRRGGSIQDHGRRDADRGGAAGAWHDDTALLCRRCRPAASESARHWPPHARNALASRAGETRKTKRVRLFTEFVSRRLGAYALLLAGLSVSRD